MNRPVNNQNGFTLLELMLVVTILGLVWSVAIPNYVQSLRRAQESACELNRHNIQVATTTAIRQHALKQGDPLPTLQQLVDLGFLSDVPECPSDGAYVWPTPNLTTWNSPLINCSVHFVQ